MGADQGKGNKKLACYGNAAVDKLRYIQQNWLQNAPLRVKVHCTHLQQGFAQGFVDVFMAHRKHCAASHFALDFHQNDGNYVFSLERRQEGVCVDYEQRAGVAQCGQADVIKRLRACTLAEVIDFVNSQRHRKYSILHNNCKHFVFWFREFLEGRRMYNNSGFDWCPGDMQSITEQIEDAWNNGHHR